MMIGTADSLIRSVLSPKLTHKRPEDSGGFFIFDTFL
jgi:hypothetical protein